jgi:hypothetical protein
LQGAQKKGKTDLDAGNVSIDQDFLINGNIGEEDNFF